MNSANLPPNADTETQRLRQLATNPPGGIFRPTAIHGVVLPIPYSDQSCSGSTT